MGLEIKVFNPSSSEEIDAAFADLVREHCDALYVGGDTFLHSRRDQIATLAALQGLPAALSTAGMGRSRRADKLLNELSQCLSSYRHLHEPHSQGRKAGRFACRPAIQIRTRHQSQNRQGARPRDPTDASRA